MLSFLKFLAEAKSQEHHVATTMMTGVDPHTHMGHVQDLGELLLNLPGTHKMFAMSSKAKGLDEGTRKNIFRKQTGGKIEPIIANEFDEIVNHAWSKVKNQSGKKVLHLVGGKDRESQLKSLQQGLSSGKIKNPGFDEVHYHLPEDIERTHGMSGTKMRNAVSNNNFEEYKRHLGSSFSDDEARKIMGRIKDSINRGTTVVTRKYKKSKTR